VSQCPIAKGAVGKGGGGEVCPEERRGKNSGRRSKISNATEENFYEGGRNKKPWRYTKNEKKKVPDFFRKMNWRVVAGGGQPLNKQPAGSKNKLWKSKRQPDGNQRTSLGPPTQGDKRIGKGLGVVVQGTEQKM